MAATKNRDYFWALAAVGVAAILALTFGLLIFAQQSDANARQREEAVIGNGLQARVREIENQVVPQAVWDDAVRNLDNKFDRRWARENIGQFFHAVSDFSFSAVLDAHNNVQYAMRDGVDLAGDQSGDERSAADTVIGRVRAAEAMENRNHVLGDPIQSSSLAWVHDRLFVLTATLVQPDFGYAEITHAHAPIVLTGRELDDGFLAAFGERYLLQNLHLHDGDAGAEPRDAHAPLYNEHGVAIATLDWTPQRPGWDLLIGALPALLALLGTMLAATLVLYIRARNARRSLELSEKQSAYLARHDPLTGLPNRRCFEEFLTEVTICSAKTHAPFAILSIDLDRFKELNDTFGHEVGDEALRQTASNMASRLGETAICARLDGDGFAILLKDAIGTAAQDAAEALLTASNVPLDLSVGPRLLSYSVGIAVSDDQLFEPLEMLRRADLALFRAKAEGRGCYRLYDDAMDREFKALRMMRDDLRADIAAGRLKMVYQPQVRLSGEVVGVEALVRWTHPTMGAISPSIFIPLTEESGLVHALGDFTLRQAAQDGLRWTGVKTAVNVSATQLQRPGYASHAKRIVVETGADPHNIEIELTEGVLLSNEQQVHDALTELHDAGFSIALDDFGTGYSSLSYLPRFPIDKIKIDRSFVAELGHDPKADALFTAIVGLAHTLGMRVIAEGVETKEQWLQLSAAGCPKIQGYVASKPLSADDAESFITHEREERSDAAA